MNFSGVHFIQGIFFLQDKKECKGSSRAAVNDFTFPGSPQHGASFFMGAGGKGKGSSLQG
jgi:hypothetical protein